MISMTMKNNHIVFVLIIIYVYALSWACARPAWDRSSPISDLKAAARDREFIQIPTPIPGNAHVVGRVLSMSGDFDLLLAENIGKTSNDKIYGMDINNAKRAIIYDNGVFLFMNIKPGRYAIIAWNPVFSYLIEEIEVTRTGIIDVGEIKIRR